MTSQSPRIYTYKITFEEVPYYYYGMHEEKKYDEEYWGSPKTNKWAWEFYTPKKQILETFDTRQNAYEVEKRLIKPVYKTDKWCLNASAGNAYCRSKEQMIEDGRKSAETHRKNKTGAFDPERRMSSNGGKIVGRRNVESGHLGEISNLKYICTETGFISGAAGLTYYQTNRGIDKSKRRLLTQEEYRERTRREFTVISPDGKTYTDDNIDKFCKEHNLFKPLFVDLLDKRKISHMGFHLPGNKVKFFVNYEVKTPNGEIVSIKNISKFCRENSTSSCKLIVGTFHSMLKGKIKEYKGYTLHKNLISS
jgi:hypothetical protein